MKQIIILLIVLVFSMVLFAIIRGNIPSPINFLKPQSTLTVNGKTFNVIFAKSDKEKMQGLSERKSLDSSTGMLFVFDKKDYYSFWMRDMNFPIDIIYIDDDKIIDIKEDAKAPKTKNSSDIPIYKPKSPANKVFEINAGLSKKNNIKIGDKIVIKEVK